MKNCLKILLGILIYTSLNISAYASSISPITQEITLGKGERTVSDLIFRNEDESAVELKISTYSYNPKTDSIYDKKEDIFLKTDTDTTIVQPGESKKISYEIYPLSNTPEGTYFNLVVLTPVSTQTNIALAESPSQLVILHIVENENEINNITTEDFTVNVQVKEKGFPFLQPIKIQYSVTNNSNFVITPDGNIEVFNTKGKYKSYTASINKEGKRLYPKETLEEEIEIKGFNLSDIFFERTAVAHIYNGLDSKPKNIPVQIHAYKIELVVLLVIIVTSLILVKSIRSDND